MKSKWPTEEEVAEAVRRIKRVQQEEASQNLAKPNNDLISRQAAIEAIANIEVGNHDQQNIREGAVFMLEQLPLDDTDMSDYSDRLWEAAYERGKAEGHKLSEETSTFIEWLLAEVIDEDNWELNAVALGEIICRKLTKMGFLTINDDGCYVRANVKPTDCDDCISREKILEHAYRREGVMSVSVDSIKLAPSVTPTERAGEWISVSDGLPKVKQEVYVTVYFTEGDTGRAYGYIDGFGNWHLYSAAEGRLNSGYEVTAWMPLPEPYKEGDTE